MKRRHVSEGVGDHPPEGPWIGRSHMAKLAAPALERVPIERGIHHPPICHIHNHTEPCPRCEEA